MKEEEKEKRRTRTNTVSSQSHHQQHPPREKDTFDAHHHAQFKSINEEAKKCSLIVASFYATKPGGFDRKKGEEVQRVSRTSDVHHHGKRAND